MLGAIAGDMIGSIYEFDNIKTKDFPLFGTDNEFTDDSILTVAIADAILNQSDYAASLKHYFRRYPNPMGSYGGRFLQWAASDEAEPYNSWGNGSAMRVSAIGFAFNNLETVLREAKRSAEVAHNHPEGVRGAQSTAATIFLARTGHSKDEIKTYIESIFAYHLSNTLDEIRPTYRFDVSCQGSVPQAIIAFLESTDFEDAIRNAISLGGDSDTIACITGGIAQAFYGEVPAAIAQEVWQRLDQPLRQVAETFMSRYNL
jgi:ADP-ribosylglycohydrolase